MCIRDSVKAEIISWFRIQEMFRLDSFHMYGVIGLAVIVGAVSYTHLRAHETVLDLVCRLLLEKKNKKN